MIKLNVGGRLFVTTEATLLSQNEENFFSSLLSGRFTSLRDENSAYFIDRNGSYFEVILEYLRSQEIEIPQNISREAIFREAQFYCLTTMTNLMKQQDEVSLRQQEEIKRKSSQPIRLDGVYVKQTHNPHEIGSALKFTTMTAVETTNNNENPNVEADVTIQGIQACNNNGETKDELYEGKVVVARGIAAEDDLMLFLQVPQLPTIWQSRDGFLQQKYASFIERHIVRGKYWMQGNKLKLQVSIHPNDAVLGLGIGNFLYLLEGSSHELAKYTFHERS